MSENIKLFFNGIVNSLNPDGYYNVVTPPRKLGLSARDVTNNRRKKHQSKIVRINNARSSISTTA
jgi:hypothetical protein